MVFPVSGAGVPFFVPVIVAFAISFFTSMGGVSGAFLLLPFQISVLGISAPSASPTNLVYNIVAIPSGVYRYIREGRMAWGLAMIVIVGTLPGVFLGVFLRIRYLPDPNRFKVFVGCVLLYIALRLLYELRENSGNRTMKAAEMENRFREQPHRTHGNRKQGDAERPAIKTLRFSPTDYTFTFYGEAFTFNPPVLFLFALAVGIIGGAYGIGGGALVAPFLVTIFGLPIYAIAGAALLGTFLTSIAGVAFYVVLAPLYAHTGLSIAPDWGLGILFGMGGFIGIYGGARFQRYFPARAIKAILGLAILFLSVRYIMGVLTL